MDDFFRRHPNALWPAQERLHVYATGTAAVRAMVEQYQQALRPLAEANGLGFQPPQWQHLTVQMLHRTRPEVPAEKLDDLVKQLTKNLAEIEPITVVIGPPQVSRHAIELWVHPDADDRWLGLVNAVRHAVTGVLGEDALPPLGPNARPHTSIGYGTGRGDSGALTSALQAVRAEPVELRVDQVHLVAVTQHPTDGMFTWDVLESLPLGG
ncbi:2'-5' RNA ligase family protein [Saccharopolyspora shandongensis]|uniref:2'-5' RNA ligase family protein n=1 Tax=Saccharopolyspora shandongensis TaxID=418495 RepID=UPI0033C8395B